MMQIKQNATSRTSVATCRNQVDVSINMGIYYKNNTSKFIYMGTKKDILTLKKVYIGFLMVRKPMETFFLLLEQNLVIWDTSSLL